MSTSTELLIRFAESAVVVAAPGGVVREGVHAMFGLMVADEAPEVVARFEVEARGGGYRIRRSARFAERHAFPEAADDLKALLRLLKCHVLQALIDRHPEHLWLHAGAAASEGRAVLVAGMWGSGKSTLVERLCAAGWAYLSDDVVPLRAPDAAARPFPLGLAVREAAPGPIARADVGGLPKRRVALPPEAVAPPEVPVAAVVFPRYDPSVAVAEAARIAPGEATLALLRCLFNLGDHGGAAVAHLGALAGRVPAYLLRYADPEEAAALAERLADGAVEVEATASLADGGDAERVDPWLRVLHPTGDAAPSLRPPPAPTAGAAERVEWTPWAWPDDGRKLTVGMAVYDDYDGVYFTLQALRLYHPEVADEVEFVLVDNNPDGPCGEALRRLCGPAARCRYVPNRTWRGTASRDILFREARTPYVLCVDAHVLVAPGALRRLIDYLDADPGAPDLLQGPLLHDDFSVATHFEPVWREGMYGTWGTDERGAHPDGPPFEIPMQGLGLFACRRAAWPGFNPRFSGFGGEEGYLHEKIRQRGGRTLCLPFLRWMHRFERPLGVRYPLAWADRIHNYTLGFRELGLDEAPLANHFRDVLGDQPALRELAEARTGADHPLAYFDAVYGLDERGEADRWQAMVERLRPHGLARRIRRHPLVASEHAEASRALTHRRVVEEARRHGLRHVLVLEDGAVLADDAAVHLRRSVDELGERAWALCYLGGRPWAAVGDRVPGCGALRRAPDEMRRAYGVAYHHTIFDRLLADLPADAETMQRWCSVHRSIEAYHARLAPRYAASPFVVAPPEENAPAMAGAMASAGGFGT